MFRLSIPDTGAAFIFARFRVVLALPMLVGVATSSVLLANGIAEPDGYRISDYMAPVPATLKGATTVDAETVQMKLQSGSNVVLIDVLPLQRKPPDFPSDRLWRTPPRYNIPNSVWLPNVGYGNIEPKFEAYFIENLKKLTVGQTSAKAVDLVFYCLEDCWMSWNAAKRALEFGY